MSQVDPTADATKQAGRDLAGPVRVAQNWSAYEDALLVLVIGLYDELTPAEQLGGVNDFVVKTALWSMSPEESLSNDQILSLFDALQSLHDRGLIEFHTESGGRFQAHPLEPGRHFAAEDVHAAWIDIFDRRLSAGRLTILGKLHELSYQPRDGLPMLSWVDEAKFLPSLAAGDDGAQPGYEAWAEASRNLEELKAAGFIKTRPDRARPTYAACVRVERGRPLVVFPDVVGRLEQALANDARFAGALRKLRTAVSQASERPYPNAEDAIKNAASAVESAAQEITHEQGDLADQARILTRRGLFSPATARIAGDLFIWRSATQGVAHGAAAQPAVDEREARLAIQVAAGLIAYLAEQIGPPS
jgi:hypothetical protein